MPIVTWNMQGASHSTENKWNLGVLNLLNYNDLCCLQECGGIPGSAVSSTQSYNNIPGLGLYTWGGSSSRGQKYILFYPADPNGNRCNLAIVSKVAPTAGFLFLPAVNPWRPTIGMTVAGTVFFTLHAISPNGVDAPALVNGAFGAAGAQVIVAGDYNRNYGTMGGGSQVVCPPNAATHPAINPVSYYDYAIKNFGAATVGTVLNLYLSDHLPVQF